MSSKPRSKSMDGDLRPGDRVRFQIGRSTFHARVIEDRGHLGVGGRQIVRIEVVPASPLDGHVEQFEMPAEDLTRENPAA
jgi:hypothetical protein